MDVIRLKGVAAVSPLPGLGRSRVQPPYLPLAAHRPVEDKRVLPAVLQDPQPAALLKGGVPHPVLESQQLPWNQLLLGSIQLEDVDHRQPARRDGMVRTVPVAQGVLGPPLSQLPPHDSPSTQPLLHPCPQEL